MWRKLKYPDCSLVSLSRLLGYKKTYLVKVLLSFCVLYSLISMGPDSVIANGQGSPLPLIIATDVLTDYHKFLGNREVHEVKEYSGEFSRRDVVEVVLLQQALKRGGFQSGVIFKTANTYTRTLEEVVAGRAAITANTAWLDDIVEKGGYLQESLPMINPGEFLVGIYTSPKNKELLNVTDSTGLQDFSVVSNKNWRTDWATLQEMGVSNIINIQKWMSMVRMVDAMRVDFLLAPFQDTIGMTMEIDGMELVPLQGKTVSLKGSRHFAISKKHPQSIEIQNALEQGIKSLRSDLLIKKAYRDSGFFNPVVEQWQVLN